jgi:hypothetical protein
MAMITTNLGEEARTLGVPRGRRFHLRTFEFEGLL